MDVGERKEESSLPPDYVSLAQLQERWLKKQEERKLKQKQEEEEKRERDARAAQNEKNQNQNQRGMRNDGRAKMAGGFVREKGVIQDQGKGKEIFTGGPGIRGENDKKREINRGRSKKNFKRAAAVEPKEKAGVEAEELSGGDTVRAGISSGGVGGVGGGLNGVEEKRNVSVEVLARNGVKEEIADVKRTDLRGGLRGNGRNQGSGRVNELKQSEMALDLEKKMEGEKGYGKKWRERPRNGSYPERLNRLQEYKPVDLEGNKVDHALEKKAGVEVSEFRSEISSLSVGNRNGIWGRSNNGSNKAEEYRVEGEGSNGDKVVLEIEKKMEGEKGYGRRGRGRGRGGGGGRNGDYPERFNRIQEHRPVVLEVNKVDPELEKKAEDDVSELSSELSSLSVGDRNGIRGRSSSGSKEAEEDRVEGEGSNDDKVVLEIEKKMEGEKGYGGRGRGRGRRKGGRRNGDYTERFNRFQEHRPVVLEGNKVDPELEKKAEDDVSELSSELSSLSVGDRNGIRGRSNSGSNKAEEDRVVGEGSNGDEVVLEIEKKMEGEKGYGGRGRRRGRNGDYPERFNRFQEHRPVVLEGNKVDPKLEKKAEDSELSSELSSLSVGDRNGIQGRGSKRSNKAEEDRVEGEGSNGDRVVLEIEKKMEGEKGYGGRGRGGGGNGDYPERFNRFQEHRRVVLEGNKVDSEMEKKAGDEVSDVGSEISSLSVGDRNGIWVRIRNGSKKAEEDRVEGEGSNGDKVALEIEKKVDHEVLPGESARKGENRGAGKGYQIYGNQRGDFGWGRRDTRPEISGGRWEMKPRVTGMVWVKKEEKLGA